VSREADTQPIDAQPIEAAADLLHSCLLLLQGLESLEEGRVADAREAYEKATGSAQ
jgi:hypothetical protein